LLLAVFSSGCKKNEANRLTPRSSPYHARAGGCGFCRGARRDPIKLRQGASSQQPGNTDYLRIVLKNDSRQIRTALQSPASPKPRYRRNPKSSDARPTHPNRGSASLQASTFRRAGTPNRNRDARNTQSIVGAKDSTGRVADARLAIIIDDLGSDRPAADAVFALAIPSPFPSCLITSIRGHRQGSASPWIPGNAALADAIGRERNTEAQELRPGMSAPEVAALVDQFLQNTPDAAGVNNHQGSQATADAALMDALMPVLRDHNLFYVDSRTTAATVAYDTAQDFGVRSAFRNVPFLDDVAEWPRSANSSNWRCAALAKRAKPWRSAILTRDAPGSARSSAATQAQGVRWCWLRTRPLIGLFSLRLRRLRFLCWKKHMNDEARIPCEKAEDAAFGAHRAAREPFGAVQRCIDRCPSKTRPLFGTE